ncbi:F0F1 ATP synthase subunit alpha, partial [Candidatus Berkelbacteria bacterium]|nr:F0F1 ATP synthase subunit alpha [Candidatus Berkelbacteria bacterium]
GSDLDEATRQQLERGKRVSELLKQPQFQPLAVADQVIGFYAVNHGYLDDVPVERIGEFEQGLLEHFRSKFPNVREKFGENPKLDEVEEELKKVIEDFKRTRWVDKK